VTEPATQEGVAGRYAIFGEIASGGMAKVHVGRLLGPRGFARTVAIKRLHDHYARDPDFAAMFLDEAHLAARVRHPNVVPTLDVVADGGQLLLVMEYVAGESLSRLERATWARGERIAPEVASAIVTGVLHGLHAAHEAKNDFGEPLDLVHRDVSPQNILVGSDGVPRVVDFGVAKALGRLHETRDSAVKGKAPYMAPEQIRGLAVTRRTDVFAATVVLWEALTGQRLFAGDNDAATMNNVLTKDPPPPSSLVTDLPKAVDEVTGRGLERDPARRFQTAREMALALERAMPPALASRVGDWVEHVAADALALRAERVAEIESSSSGLAAPGLVVSTSEFIADALWNEGRSPSRPPSGKPAGAAPSRRPQAPPTPYDPSDDAPTHLMPPRAEALPAGRASARPAAKEQAPDEGQRWGELGKSIARKAAFVGLGAFAFVGILALTIPGYVRRAAVATAAAQGLVLSIDAVNVGLGGIRLIGLSATSPEMPGVRATATEMHVELSGFSPKQATVRGAELTVDGPILDVTHAAEAWFSAHHGPQARSGGEERDGDWLDVVVPTVHLMWTHAAPGDVRIDAPECTGEIRPHATPRLGDEFHWTTQKLTVTTSAGVLGPWRVDFDREVNGARLRVAFDPPVPDGPNALLVKSTAGSVALDVSIPRSPLGRLGVPPTLAGLVPTTPSQIETKAHLSLQPPSHVEANASIVLFGAHVAKAPGPLDVTLSGSVGGTVGDPLDVKDGALSAGLIRATLTGPVTINDDGVSAALAWKATPVPCASLMPQAKRAADDLNKQLAGLGDLGDLKDTLAELGLDAGALAQTTGVVHVTGTLQASGTLTLDSTDMTKTAFTTNAKNSCGLGLFAK
jgi:serine/threonine protein kinase